VRPLPFALAGSAGGGSGIPPSKKPSAEGTVVCSSSDVVQTKIGPVWYTGTIQTWNAATVYVDRGVYYGDAEGGYDATRQYSSLKRCESIQPAPELEQELRQQLDAYQCRLGRHVYGGNATSVEDALCRGFGRSSEGNWYREGLTTDQKELLRTWEGKIEALPALKDAWEQYTYCQRPSLDWTNGNYVGEEEWFSNKAKDLEPTHHWNVAATAVSFCGLLVWILLSPHRGNGAEQLDQKLGSFYAMQFASNLLVAVASVLYSCKSSVFYSLFLLVYVGGSVVGTNILCHRYLMEKATAMSKV
jgi:hypothetical protein